MKIGPWWARTSTLERPGSSLEVRHKLFWQGEACTSGALDLTSSGLRLRRGGSERMGGAEC